MIADLRGNWIIIFVIDIRKLCGKKSTRMKIVFIPAYWDVRDLSET